jgi:predicted permease
MNWRRFLRRDEADSEQREELDFYVETTAQEYMERGMEPAEARAAARRKLGNTTRVREEIYRMNTFTLLESLLRDARHALRMIRAKPGFSLVVLLSLALGIGANTAIFSVLNAILIRPLPYAESERLVGVFNRFVIQGQVYENAELSARMYVTCKENARVFESFGVWTPDAATVTGRGDPEQVATITVTQGVLPTLGVPPSIGRWFSNEDDTPGSPETVILSYGYWQRKFGGDGDVIGGNVVIDSVPHRVIGVMPRSFQVVNFAPDLLLPQRFPSAPAGPDEFGHRGIARLKPGVTVVMANQDLARVWKIWGETTGAAGTLDGFHITPNLRPLKKDVVGDVGAVLSILMGALGLVLVLVCANVANLVLVRAQSRQQEFAMRVALGAGWGRIARELLVESLTMGILGGALGVALASVGLRVLVAQGPDTLPRLQEVSLDGTAVAFAVACSLGTSLLFGLAAILRFGVPGRIQSVRGATQGAQQLRVQNALVVSQVAIAFVLLVASGLTLRTFVALRAVSPGFTHPEWIQTVRIVIPESQTSDPDRIIRIQSEILSRLSALPGVTAAGFASGLPLEWGYRNGVLIDVEGKTSAGEAPPNRAMVRISPGLLAAQGTRLVAGRDFTWEDVLAHRRVALVSENMARENWGDPGRALGQRIRQGLDGPWLEVVGVAENVRAEGMNLPAPTTVYFSARGHGATFAIRSERAGTEAFQREVASAIHAVSPDLPLADVRTLNDVYLRSMARTSFTLVLLGIAGSMALALATIGVYGVLAYAVGQRRHEVAIRVALGGEPRMLKWLFVRTGLILNLMGGVIGLVFAAGLSRWMSSLLFGVAPVDPFTYLVSGALVGAAAMVASYLPARQAASVDPMETLRSE